MIGRRSVLALTVLLATVCPAMAGEAEFTPAVSLADLVIPKENLPQGWTLLEKRVVRDPHDTNLLVTVDAGAKALGPMTVEKACQPLTVAGQSFNVDLFLVKEPRAAKVLFGLLRGWTNPKAPGDIQWSCDLWHHVIMVVGSSDKAVQEEVVGRYLGRMLDVLGARAAEQLKQGQKDKALACYRFLGEGVNDLPHAYQAWGGQFQYTVKDLAKAIAFYERAAKEGGPGAFTVEEQWQIHEGIGLCAGMTNDLPKAEAAFLKSLALARKSLKPGLVSESTYNLACAYAEKQVPDKMYSYLEETLKLDAKRGAEASADSSFARYATQPRFKALLAKYAK